MAFSHGTAARMFLDGFAGACYINDFSASGDIDTSETTVLCNTAKQYIPGLEDATVSFSGFLDFNSVTPTSTFEYMLSARKRVIFPVVFLPNAGATGVGIQGQRAYMFNGELTSYKIGTKVDEASTIEAEFQSNTGLEAGMTLTPLTTATVTNPGAASIDNLASSANGLTAVLSVSAVSGTTPTLSVIIEHSPDNSAWGPLITFGTKNTVTAEYASVTGTVQRYIRARWVIAGTTPSFTFHVATHRL